MTMPSSHRQSAAQRFSRAARTYDDRSHIQAQAAEQLLSLLRDLPEPAHILEAGCGTGQLTYALRRRFPRAKIVAFDLAPDMAAATRARFSGDRQVRVAVADFTAPPAGRLYDLIISGSALHWAESLPDAVAALARRLAPDGLLAAVLMLNGTLAELLAARAAAVPDNPPRRALPTPDAVRSAFQAAGLHLIENHDAPLLSRHPDPLDLLESLRHQGLTGGDFSRGVRPLTRGEIARLVAEYDLRFPHPDGGIRATYLVGWYCARLR